MYIKFKKLTVSLVLIFMISGCTGMTAEEKQIYEKKIESELEAKYGKNFTILMTYESGNSGSGPVTVSDVKCEDDGILFQIGGGSDNYLQELWSAQGAIPIKETLNELYTQEYRVKFTFGKADKQGLEHLSYEEVLVEQKKNNTSSTTLISYYIFVDGEIDKEKEAKKVYEIFKKHILDREINNYFFTVTYLDVSYLEIFDAADGLHGSNSDMERLHNENIYINNVGILDTDKVSTLEEVLKKFKY